MTDQDLSTPERPDSTATLDDVLAALSLSNIYAARNYDVLMAILREHNPEMTTAVDETANAAAERVAFGGAPDAAPDTLDPSEIVAEAATETATEPAAESSGRSRRSGP